VCPEHATEHTPAALWGNSQQHTLHKELPRAVACSSVGPIVEMCSNTTITTKVVACTSPQGAICSFRVKFVVVDVVFEHLLDPID
jgi:hypothetical protein